MSDSRKVYVVGSGETATFTQSGLDPDAGFIRIKGKTVRGFVTRSNPAGPRFYAWSHGKNYALTTSKATQEALASLSASLPC